MKVYDDWFTIDFVQKNGGFCLMQFSRPTEVFN